MNQLSPRSPRRVFSFAAHAAQTAVAPLVLLLPVAAAAAICSHAAIAAIATHSTIAAATTNPLIDLTVAGPQQPQTDAEVFDESVIFAPNFAVNQNDPALSDLFDDQGLSELCFPTSFAEVLIDLFAYHSPKLDALKLAGISSDHKTIDPNAVVRQLFSLCHTDRNNGTGVFDAIGCVVSILSQSGYGAGDTQLIAPFAQTQPDPALPTVTREVTIQDLRDALGAGHPVILEAAWFSFDPDKKQWVRHSGHYVSVYGYDYDWSWGENQIQVKVLNPESVFASTREDPLFDTITIERISPQPGVDYPVGRPFVLSGAGFGGVTKRGFLGALLVVAPTLPN